MSAADKVKGMDLAHDTPSPATPVGGGQSVLVSEVIVRNYAITVPVEGGPGSSVAADPSPPKLAAPAIAEPTQPTSVAVDVKSASQPSHPNPGKSAALRQFDVRQHNRALRGEAIPLYLQPLSQIAGWLRSGVKTRVARYSSDFNSEAGYTLARVFAELCRVLVLQKGSTTASEPAVVPGLKEVHSFAGRWPCPPHGFSGVNDFKSKIIARGLTQACVHRLMSFLLTVGIPEGVFSLSDDVDRWKSGLFRRPFGTRLPSLVLDSDWEKFVSGHWPRRDAIARVADPFTTLYSKVVQSRTDRYGAYILKCEDAIRGSYELCIHESDWNHCVNSSSEWRSREVCRSLCVLTPKMCRMPAMLDDPDDNIEESVYVWLTDYTRSAEEEAANRALKPGEESKLIPSAPRVFVASPEFVRAMRDEVMREWKTEGTVPLIRETISGDRTAYSAEWKAFHYLASLYSEAPGYLKHLYEDYFVPIFSNTEVTVKALASPDWSSFVRSGMDDLLPLFVCFACGYSELEFLRS